MKGNLCWLRNVAMVALGSVSSSAYTQQLVYTPVNPQFGGNPFNSTQLEADAAVSRPQPKSSTTTQTQAQLFAAQLQSQILASLADQVTEAIFGPNAKNSGTFSFGGETISFVKSLGELTVTITANGTTQTIQVPTVETSGGGVTTSGGLTTASGLTGLGG